MESFKEITADKSYQKSTPTVSAVLNDGTIIETVFSGDSRETAFLLWKGEKWFRKKTCTPDPRYRLIPYSPNNNLIRNNVILFPSKPEEYESEQALIAEIRAFIHRYVDLSPFFETIAAYYVLFSWVYDGFRELPYLRVKGDPGCGKTRFLITVGSICYKPVFASGASTISPIFRILDAFRGTLIIDESDFRVSDEKAEVIKIFNNGNVHGFPVLRSESTGRGEFNPHAYHVFGPKLIATRGTFTDRALESRCLTEQMGTERLRHDIPINEPPALKEEALHLRNKLLLFRFRTLAKCHIDESLADRNIEPRLNQIFMPLLSIIEDDEVREELRRVLREYHADMVNDRGMDTEAQILEVIQSLRAMPDGGLLSIGAITTRFTEIYGDEYDRKITNKWVGNYVRKRLNLKTHKSNGVFVIPPSEYPKLNRQCERYGIAMDHQENVSAGID